MQTLNVILPLFSSSSVSVFSIAFKNQIRKHAVNNLDQIAGIAIGM